MFTLHSGQCRNLLDLAPGSCQWGAPFGARWNHNRVLYTDGESAVVWLGWGDETCGVHISCSLTWICTIVFLHGPILVLCYSIVLPSSIGLPHIFLRVP